ncbi:hypothetical protein BDW69DRAFT_190222 [Aspergillus filifer]
MQCDRLLPECRRCQVRGVRCPGYRRALKFCNRTTDSDFTDAKQFDKLQKAKNASALALAAPRPTIDESRVPNLACKAFDTQGKEVFEYVVMTTFPVTFLHFAPRLEPNWVDFVKHHQAAKTEPIEKGMRCLNLWYMGVRNNDAAIAERSRHAYGDALRCLARWVGNPRTRTSEITLAAAIMIAVFEMLDPVTPHSWLIHSRGIAGLIRLRGARVHSSGFGRTMFITIRSFLLVDAFVRREPSFLGERDWREANQEATVVECRNGKESWTSKIVEQVFNEISMGPALLSQTSALTTGDSSGVSRGDLVSRINASRGILRNLLLQISSISGEENAGKDGQTRAVAKHCLQGISSGIALLEQLLVLIEADKKRCDCGAKAWGGSTVPSGTMEGPFSGNDRPLDWLDQISMSMGTLAISNNNQDCVVDLGD